VIAEPTSVLAREAIELVAEADIAVAQELVCKAMDSACAVVVCWTYQWRPPAFLPSFELLVQYQQIGIPSSIQNSTEVQIEAQVEELDEILRRQLLLAVLLGSCRLSFHRHRSIHLEIHLEIHLLKAHQEYPMRPSFNLLSCLGSSFN
jgi:hypothetical protein